MPRVCRPGLELEKILAVHWVAPIAPGDEKKAARGILGVDGEGCQCIQHAKHMDDMGPDWCQENLDVIVGWMKDEAKRRGWKVFSRVYARHLVRKAISRARKALADWQASNPG